MKVSIIIPAHNEENRISRTLDNYLKFFSKLKANRVLDFEIIVVLNACKDNTLIAVKRFSCKELKILNFERGGKGFAIIEGFKEALNGNSELIGFIDADMSTNPESFYELIKNIRNYDGAIANRWDKRSKVNYSAFKKLRSLIYNFIMRVMFLFPYRDTQCGAKLFTRKILKKTINRMVSSDWNFDVAFLFCLRKEANARIISVPTVWNDVAGTKINLFGSPIKMLIGAMRLRLIHSPFKFLVKIYRKLPERLKIHNKL